MAKWKWQTNLDGLKNNTIAWESLKPQERTDLIKRGAVDAQGNVMEQAPSELWRVEFYAKQDKGDWYPAVSPAGEPLMFPNEQDAFAEARKLSVIDNREYRVVRGMQESFSVFDDGQRYWYSGKAKTKIRMETDFFIDDEDGEDLDTYRLQVRLCHVYNDNRFASWSDANKREYPDFYTAVEDGLKLSRAKPRNEYRVVTMVTGTPTQPVVYHAGSIVPDAELIEQMCTALTDGRDRSQASVIAEMLTRWKGPEEAHQLIHEMLLEVSHDR